MISLAQDLFVEQPPSMGEAGTAAVGPSVQRVMLQLQVESTLEVAVAGWKLQVESAQKAATSTGFPCSLMLMC